MEINVVQQLKKLCRICFGVGDYNLREHKVKLPPCEDLLFHRPVVDEHISLDEEMMEEELTVQEMLKVFSEIQTPEFVGAKILQLICNPCLDELIPSFMFVQKVKFADKRIAKLINADDVKMEMDLEGEQTIEYLEDPQDEFLDENYKLNNEGQLNQFAERMLNETILQKKLVESSNDNITSETFEVIPATSPTTIGQKRKVSVKNPTIVLTGGVTQMLSHINRYTDTTKSTRPVALTKPSPQKRLRTLREKKKQQSSPAQLEQGSFVVTQFIPSTTRIQLEPVYSNEEQPKDGQAADYTTHCNELRTMDYAAVEIQCTSDLQVNENDNYVGSGNNPTDTTNTADFGSGGDPNNFQPIYVCKYCPQAFSAAHFLITHVRKSHVCKFCIQAFSKSTELFEHIRNTHTEHRCAICGKELSTHSNLRSHIKRVHGVKLPAQVALLDYRRQINVLSPHNQASDEIHDFEANLIDSFDVVNEDDKIELSVDQQQEKIEFDNDIHLMQEEVVATVDVVEKQQMFNYKDNVS